MKSMTNLSRRALLKTGAAFGASAVFALWDAQSNSQIHRRQVRPRPLGPLYEANARRSEVLVKTAVNKFLRGFEPIKIKVVEV